MSQTIGDPESAKTALEIQKLNLEIDELRKWWRRPTYVQAILSVFVAICTAGATIGVGYFNGWFDVQRGRLEMQRAEVRQEIEALKAGRSKLHDEIVQLKTDKFELAQQNEYFKANTPHLQARVDRLVAIVATLKETAKLNPRVGREIEAFNRKRAEPQPTPPKRLSYNPPQKLIIEPTVMAQNDIPNVALPKLGDPLGALAGC